MPKRTKQTIFPEAQSPFLNEMISSLRKRAKSIRHSGADIAIQRVIERDGGEEIEKLEIQLKDSMGPQIDISLWSDRWIFVHAGKLDKRGWSWEWMKEGRVVTVDKDHTFVTNLQKMINNCLYIDKPAEFCEALWKSFIATGPSTVFSKSSRNSAD